MKILWVNSDFLHPTTRGGQIRTLEMLKRLHQRHEIHYAGLDRHQLNGLGRSSEYCTEVYAVPHSVPRNFTPRFWWQAASSSSSGLPLSVLRYRSDTMARRLDSLLRVEMFDAIVCDFLASSANLPNLSSAILFQHNVESTIWKRHAENPPTSAHGLYFRGQYRRMLRYEAEVCRAVKQIVAVSDIDAETMRSLYGVTAVSSIPTGVDLDYFTPPDDVPRTTDLVFLGSMDWRPNIDGLHWFINNVLPRILRRRPDCSLAVVGRRPTAEVRRWAESNKNIRVTGTVDDIRPHLWGSGVAIVPLRIGGGTRLKIYEAMAAKISVVSTSVGAEGLDIGGGNIAIADSPQEFAERCLALLDDQDARTRMTRTAWEMIAACYSWEVVAREFEKLLA
jgi:glycosyltransferase involved in cell wall biosynthesis